MTTLTSSTMLPTISAKVQLVVVLRMYLDVFRTCNVLVSFCQPLSTTSIELLSKATYPHYFHASHGNSKVTRAGDHHDASSLVDRL